MCGRRCDTCEEISVSTVTDVSSSSFVTITVLGSLSPVFLHFQLGHRKRHYRASMLLSIFNLVYVVYLSMPGHRRRAVRTLDLIDDDSRILRCVRYSAVHDKQTTKCTSERSVNSTTTQHEPTSHLSSQCSPFSQRPRPATRPIRSSSACQCQAC